MGGYEFDGYSGDALYLPDNVSALPEVGRELSKILTSKDTAERFIEKYNRFIDKIGRELQGAAQGVEWLKRVKGSNKLWCMKFKKSSTIPNIRILLTITDNEAILWHAFIEQKVAEYKKAIDCAERRMRENGR